MPFNRSPFLEMHNKEQGAVVFRVLRLAEVKLIMKLD